MIPVEIIGLKSDLQVILNTLRDLGSLHIDDVSDSSQVSARKLTLDRQTLNKQEEASFLFARVEGLLNSLSIESTHTPVPIEGDLLSQVRSGMEKLAPQVQAIITQKEELQAKLSMLPRYETTLRKLLPIIPPSIHEAGNVSIGVLVSRSHLGILDSIATQVMDLTAGRAEVVASDVDASTRGMFIVIPKTYTSKVEALLGKEDVTRLRLPIELGEGPPDIALQALRNQLALMPSQISDLSRKMAGLAAEWGAQLLTWRNALREVLDTNSVVTLLGETDMTFVLVGWVPANEFDSVEKALDEKIGEALLVRQLPLTEPMKKLAPVALENPEIARPFESLVNILALPRYGHIDPTRLMAIFLPIFFGMILGDIGYGALVLGISLVLMRKYRTGVIHDILFVLTMGGGWSIVFGFLYGELFGTLRSSQRGTCDGVIGHDHRHRSGAYYSRIDPGNVGRHQRQKQKPPVGTRRDATGFDRVICNHRRISKLFAKFVDDARYRRSHHWHCTDRSLLRLAGNHHGSDRIYWVNRKYIVLPAYRRHRSGIGLPGKSS
jgi:V/A-type H+-transporting ATPase subunit I